MRSLQEHRRHQLSERLFMLISNDKQDLPEFLVNEWSKKFLWLYKYSKRKYFVCLPWKGIPPIEISNKFNT